MALGDFSHRLLVYHVMKAKQRVTCVQLFTVFYSVLYCIDPALQINVSKLFVFDVSYLSLMSFIHSIFKVFTFYHQSID